MIRAVLDTNVLVSGALTALTPPGQLLDAWRDGRFELVISEHLLNELLRTLQKPYFERRLSAGQIQAFVAAVREQATPTSIAVRVHGVASHPEDDLTLATAVSGHADYLVTGDVALIRKVEARFRGVKLVSARDFLEVLQKAPAENEEEAARGDA